MFSECVLLTDPGLCGNSPIDPVTGEDLQAHTREAIKMTRYFQRMVRDDKPLESMNIIFRV
jgi:hypothetical protein